MMPNALVWFRRDLRIKDNPALDAALRANPSVIPIYIFDPDAPLPMGAASKVWLHHSLKCLDTSFKKHNGQLVIARGNPVDIISSHLAKWKIGSVYFNHVHEPTQSASDDQLVSLLKSQGIAVHRFEDGLISPNIFFNQQGKPYKVFTPFYRSLISGPPPPMPTKAPATIDCIKISVNKIDDLDLIPKRGWAKSMMSHWQTGEAGAHKALGLFIEKSLSSYPTGRDYPADDDTSRLSPHLHFGEISVRDAWHTIEKAASKGSSGYLRELAWREFAIHLLHHFPHTVTKPLNPVFEKMPWKKNAAAFKAWQQGRTGYPIVDAGMRELWGTGFMHNRVRMIVGSFLIKDLLIDWKEGFDWFWDTLVDADLASNTLNWQWVAGCGADASPFFRIFNPMLQSKRFDKKGTYIKRWVPELSDLDEKAVHALWETQTKYSKPIVDHAQARKTALEIYAKLKK